MLSNLEQHFTVESLHHEIPLEEDDVSSSSSDSDTDSIQNGEQGDDLPELPWTDEEDEILINQAQSMDPKNWALIAEQLPGRTNRECKRRWGRLQRSGDGRARTPWTKEEDEQLKELVAQHGSKAWKMISSMMPGRKSKQCRERWTNVVDPKLNYAPWTEEEEQILILAQQELGNKWSQIEKRLPGRSANSIKNYWYSALRRGERKRAKMERKAMQPEGKKRRPRKPKTDEEMPILPAEETVEPVISEGDDKPKKKGTKRKKRDDVTSEEATEGVKDAALAVDDAPVALAVSDDTAEKASKKAKKTKEPKAKAGKGSTGDVAEEVVAAVSENAVEAVTTEVAEKKASKVKKNAKTAAAAASLPVEAEVIVEALPASSTSSVEEDSANGKAGKRKTVKPTEEEKLLKPAAKKRRKNIAIVDENLST